MKKKAIEEARDDSDSSSESDSGDKETGLTLFKRAHKRAKVSTALDNKPTKEHTQEVSPKEKEQDEDEELEVSEWSFAALGLSPWLVQACHQLGMQEPTPVQKQCILPTLKGYNLIGSAPTGSGKTAAFALPILETLAQDLYGVFAVVVTPTRELAFQIGDQFRAIGAALRIRCEVIVGGTTLIEQQQALAKRPHIVVATPGRLSAHLQGPSPPKLNGVKFLVLDEADRLLEPNFAKDMKVIFAATPKTRQTLLYSATMTSSLERVKRASTRKVFEFHANQQATTPGALDERYMLVPQQVKSVYLAYVLRRLGPEFARGPLAPGAKIVSKKQKLKKILENRQAKLRAQTKLSDESESEEEAVAAKEEERGPEEGEEDDFFFDRAKLVIIFTSSCKRCQLIGELLEELKVECSVLHGNLAQNRRNAALGKFRSRVTNVLVATDVASRGLDIPQVDLVVNFDVPHSVEDYIHRVGRTARAGRQGLAVTFVTQYDIRLIKSIEATTKRQLKALPGVDEENDVLVLLTRVSNAERAARLRIAAESSVNN